jgi:hypothetical protein
LVQHHFMNQGSRMLYHIMSEYLDLNFAILRTCLLLFIRDEFRQNDVVGFHVLDYFDGVRPSLLRNTCFRILF